MATTAAKIATSDPAFGPIEVRGTPVGIKRLRVFANKVAKYWNIHEEDIAEVAGLHKRTVQRFLAGDTLHPRFRTVIEILAAMECDIEVRR